MRTRSHGPPTTPTSPLSIQLYLFVDVRQGRFCDTERHTFGKLQNARVPNLSGSTNVQRTAAIAECRVIFDTRPTVVFLTEGSKVVRILPTPLLRSLFDKSKEFEEVVAPELMGDINQELLMHLKLNLAGLPDRSVTDEKLELIAQPFLQELKTVHTTLIRKV